MVYLEEIVEQARKRFVHLKSVGGLEVLKNLKLNKHFCTLFCVLILIWVPAVYPLNHTWTVRVPM